MILSQVQSTSIPIHIEQGLVATVVAALIAGFVGWKGHQLQKGTRENKLIDQLQEELEAVRKSQREDKEARAKERHEDQKRMSRIEQRDMVYIPHILRLNMHIDRELGPPAPPIPTVIQEFLDDLKTNGGT